ncbi:MAG: site-specific integrase [Balneolaceae bacterium]
MKKVKLSFIVRKSKTKANGKAPIYLRIAVDEQRKEISTKKEVVPGKWCSIRQKVRGNTPGVNAINNYLDQLKRQALNAETQLIKEGSEVSSEMLKEKLVGENTPKVELIEFFEAHLQKIKELIGNGYSENTHKRYSTCLKHVKAFLGQHYNVKKKLPVKKVDLRFVQDYEHYLKTKKNPCNHNSALKYIDHLKKVIRIAMDRGYILHDPFKGYTSKYETNDPEYLYSGELHKLAVKELPVNRVGRVRDVFLFCCYTGLAYVDVEKLTVDDVEEYADGEKWLSVKRQKTNESAYIMLLDIPLGIIDKYKDDPETEGVKLLPVISNQKTNAYLKEVAELCGIKKNLTFHMARHTFATTVALENGVPMDTVQKVLGHKDSRSTMHYARVTRTKIGSDLRNLKSKLG